VNPAEITRLPNLDAAAADGLSVAEREVLAGFEAPKRRQDWTLGRVVAKRAVREALERLGLPAPDDARFAIVSDERGAPRVEPVTTPALAVSLTHSHGQAAAWALPAGSEGGLPGVDLELVQPRRLGTLRFYLHPPEREWVMALQGHEQDPPPKAAPPSPRDHAAIVMWALKEAAFKALRPARGTGLYDLAVELLAPYDAAEGRAAVTCQGKAADRAQALGVEVVEAGWTYADRFVLAWAFAKGGRLD
jgi:phosphopantetheinyl transferase (holo-ACP synthase)